MRLVEGMGRSWWRGADLRDQAGDISPARVPGYRDGLWESFDSSQHLSSSCAGADLLDQVRLAGVGVAGEQFDGGPGRKAMFSAANTR